jgi:hypothetical protein
MDPAIAAPPDNSGSYTASPALFEKEPYHLEIGQKE